MALSRSSSARGNSWLLCRIVARVTQHGSGRDRIVPPPASALPARNRGSADRLRGGRSCSKHRRAPPPRRHCRAQPLPSPSGCLSSRYSSALRSGRRSSTCASSVGTKGSAMLGADERERQQEGPQDSAARSFQSPWIGMTRSLEIRRASAERPRGPFGLSKATGVGTFGTVGTLMPPWPWNSP